jgi:hypothetical protein
MVVHMIMARAAAAPDPASVPEPRRDVQETLRLDGSLASCESTVPAEVIICGRRDEKYRIDPIVLEALRARKAVPLKEPETAEAKPTQGCVGPNACGGGVIPLVRMALVAAEAVKLAADGEDWRGAIWKHEDEYRLYKRAEERRAKDRRVKILGGVLK